MLSAQVHPLDTHSAPYNFSSTSFPLLNNAARALHLPALSQKSYLAVFGVPTTASSTMHSSRTSSSTASSPTNNTPPLDEKYTGHIIVSGYNISYILPKEFPPRFISSESATRISAIQMRRPSVSERNSMHFMAAIELWSPYASRPPKAPFLVGSICRFPCPPISCSVRSLSLFRDACPITSNCAYTHQPQQALLRLWPRFPLRTKIPVPGS